MNDFFNVLDDFELEDFAPAGEPVGDSTFNLDVEGDSSKSDEDHDTILVEDVDYGEAALKSVKTNKDTITEDDKAEDDKIYVWSNGNNPFSSGTVRGVR